MKNDYNLIFEACVGNYIQAVEAEKRGASRIELCDNLAESGTTPSIGTIKMAKKTLKVPFFPIIRPRGGNFIYSDDELEIMKEDILQCKLNGVEGVVIGALTKENKIDMPLINSLIEVGKGMQFTFHMAFDLIENKLEAIDILSSLGINRILTRGGKKSAIEGKETLKELIEYSKGRIIILPGGGVTKDNYTVLRDYLGCKEFHGTNIV